MSIPRFYCSSPIAEAVQLELPPSAGHHAARVLRLKPGDQIVLFDGLGGEYEASIHHINKSGVLVDVGKFHSTDRESELKICLAQGLASGDKMDTIIQKAVELGVARIQPLATRKSIVKLTDERAARRAEHWRQVVISACEQCGRNRVPEVLPVEEIGNWVGREISGSRLVLAPGASRRLAEFPDPNKEITLLVGPEGGLTDDEVKLALDAGYSPVRLGPRVLRTETAGLAALAAIQALWGDY
ncbi:MAG TPA: 16S rRNA (uracil(1498)-N(3))-methyltransferase [Burkholderiales bacterium]|nr:16S rRNA (uracil(1498)-N(3))-methyltransferase [Burkholderiales bacterium]